MKLRIRISIIVIVAIVALLLPGCGQSNVSREEAAAIAREHLQQYGHYPSSVLRVEVEEGEGWSNRYWEKFGQSSVEGQKRICWVVSFYYPDPVEGSHLVVFVDKSSGEVIGGTRTK